ncbi:MAG: CBS domain-containing protein [Planctomycetales bacterium]
MSTSRVGQLSLKAVPVLEEDEPVSSAVARMRAHSHGSALVCRGGRLTGVFTERDLLHLVAEAQSLDQPVSTAMTVNPQTVTSEETLLRVIRLMDQGGYRRLPVIDAAGRPVGIIDVKSVVHFLVEHFPAGVYNSAPSALLTATQREGA